MTNHAVLLHEIETLPEQCIGEVVDFVAWIKHRKLSQIPEFPAEAQMGRGSPPATMLLSETALSKDWDTPEEDEAWAGL